MNILCFIFSWRGQYENAKILEQQINSIGVPTVVINSDEENEPDSWINIGNDCYFSDQFRKCLSLFDCTKYDFLWHIQADASFSDFSSIINSAESSFQLYNWGVYAPNVDDTFYIKERTDVFPITDKLSVVATTDNTCWIIHKDIIEILKQNIDLMDDNHYGWGWDLLLCGFSHLEKRYVIRDYTYTVIHPRSTGYMKELAEKEMIDMFNKCPENIKKVIFYIKQQHLSIKQYYINSQEKIFFYDTEII